jgi:hypothetical protein
MLHLLVQVKSVQMSLRPSINKQKYHIFAANFCSVLHCRTEQSGYLAKRQGSIGPPDVIKIVLNLHNVLVLTH